MQSAGLRLVTEHEAHGPASAHRKAWAGFVVLAVMVAGHAVLETARDTLFLSELPASRLPLLYLAVAGVTLLLARTPLQGLRAGSQRRVLTLSLALAAAVTAAFWPLVTRQGQAVLYALYLWSALFVSLVVVQFWLLIDEHFTITQARRAYGFIAAGSLVGAISGAALARAMVALVAPSTLLGLAAALFALAAVTAALLLPAETLPEAALPEGDAPAPGMQPLRDAQRLPYFRRLGLLTVLATVAGTSVDFLFKSTVAASVSPQDLGAAFANAALLQAGLGLATQLLLTGWLLRTVGVTRALVVLPVCIGLGTLGLAVGGGLVAAFVLKSVDASLRQSLQRTGMELLYLPIEDGLRRRVKPVLDVFGQRAGQALAALVLLVTEWAGAGVRTVALLLLGMTVGWVVLLRLVQHGYLDLFRDTLRRGRVRLLGSMPNLDLNALEALLSALNSRDDVTVLSALEVLSASGRAHVVPALILFHPSREVVLRAFELFRLEPREDDLPVMERLLGHPDAEIRAAALRAVAAASPAGDALRAGLEDPSPLVLATALVGTAFRSCPNPADAAARLLPVARVDASAAAALARAIRTQPSPLFVQVLRELALHPDAAVQREAALTLAEQPDADAIPALVAMLGHPRARTVARDALVAQGTAGLSALAQVVEDTRQPLEVRRAVPGALARFPPTRELVQLLTRQVEASEDGLLRFRALRALGALRTRDPNLAMDTATLRRFVETSVTQALRYRNWRMQLAAGVARSEPAAPSAGRSLLAAMLLEKERYAIERTFRALALLHEGDDVRRIYLGFQDLDPRVRASSRELLEALIRPPLRGALLTLVDPGSAPDAAEQAATYYAPRSFLGTGLLEALLGARSDALRALAAYSAAELGLHGLRPHLESLRESATPELREVLERALDDITIPAGRQADAS